MEKLFVRTRSIAVNFVASIPNNRSIFKVWSTEDTVECEKGARIIGLFSDAVRNNGLAFKKWCTHRDVNLNSSKTKVMPYARKIQPGKHDRRNITYRHIATCIGERARSWLSNRLPRLTLMWMPGVRFLGVPRLFFYFNLMFW